MSFANYDYEAQIPHKNSSPKNINLDPDEELDSAIKKTSVQMENYSMLITDFDQRMKLVGGRRDTLVGRAKTDTLQQEIVELGGAIKALLSRITSVMNKSTTNSGKYDISNRHLMMKDRLVSDFNGLNIDFQTSVKLYQERKLNYPPRSNDPQVNETTPLIQADSSQSQQQVQTSQDEIQQTELQYHLLLTEERNRQINEVAQGIREVNSIFKDLGELVSQQGESLDTVEENIMQMLANTQQASRELNKAHEYQKRKSKWSCMFLVVLCVIVLIIVLAVIN